MNKGIPFDISLPSDELIERVNDIESGKNIKEYKDSKEFFED